MKKIKQNLDYKRDVISYSFHKTFSLKLLVLGHFTQSHEHPTIAAKIYPIKFGMNSLWLNPLIWQPDLPSLRNAVSIRSASRIRPNDFLCGTAFPTRRTDLPPIPFLSSTGPGANRAPAISPDVHFLQNFLASAADRGIFCVVVSFLIWLNGNLIWYLQSMRNRLEVMANQIRFFLY